MRKTAERWQSFSSAAADHQGTPCFVDHTVDEVFMACFSAIRCSLLRLSGKSIQPKAEVSTASPAHAQGGKNSEQPHRSVYSIAAVVQPCRKAMHSILKKATGLAADVSPAALDLRAYFNPPAALDAARNCRDIAMWAHK